MNNTARLNRVWFSSNASTAITTQQPPQIIPAIELIKRVKRNPATRIFKHLEFPQRSNLYLNNIQKSEWTPTELRTGALGVKKGMMSLWDAWGQQQPVTVVQLEDTFVIGRKLEHKHGYNALVLGCKKKEISSAEDVKKFAFHIEMCQRAGIGMCLENIGEFRVSSSAGLLPIGYQMNAAHFEVGQYVDVQAKSKDKGFQGVMKRWGFKGQSASHGTSLAHRSPGSIGQRKTPGKVFKGKKMAGHMGDENVTIHNLQVLKIDRVLNLLYIKGPIPGPNESFVKIRDAIFKRDQFDPYINPPCFPTRTHDELESMPIEIEMQRQGSDPLAIKYKL